MARTHQASLPGLKAAYLSAGRTLKRNFGLIFKIVLIGHLLQLLFTATDGIVGWLWSLVVLAALIWTLARLRGPRKPKVSAAYYKGTASFLRLGLVTLWLTLLLLPAVLGQFVYTVAILQDFAPSAAERAVFGGAWLGLFVLSFYLVLRTLLAPYYVVLADARPLAAIRSSWRSTKKKQRAYLGRVGLLLLLAAAASSGLFWLFDYLFGLLGAHAGLFPQLWRLLGDALAGLVAASLILPFAIIYILDIYRVLSDGKQKTS